MESIHVEFFENKFISDSVIDDQRNESPTKLNPSMTSFSNGEKKKFENNSNETGRSQRIWKEKSFGPDFVSTISNVFLVERDRTKVLNKIPLILNIEEDPKAFSETMTSRDVAFWKETINNEMDSVLPNNSWVLVDLPIGSKPIKCKWVFRKKYNTNGSIQAFNARLVANGFTQKEGVDYFDTYTLMARITYIKVLFALASIYKLHVHQMDVKTAFLNGDLKVEVYIKQPEVFILPDNEHKVCKLVKSLYGLKQVSKQWHENFDSAILSDGFKHNGVHSCMYS